MGRRIAVLVGMLVGMLASAAPAAGQGQGVAYLAGPSIALPDGGSADGLAVGPDGSLYAGITRGGAARVVVLDPGGRFVREWPFDALTTTRGPLVLAVGPGGDVYAAQHTGFFAGADAVHVFRPDGTPVRSVGMGAGLAEVTDIEVDAAGNVYVTSAARAAAGLPDDTVVRFDATGALTGRFVPDPGNPGTFGNGLTGLAVADDGTFWVGTSSRLRPLVRFAPDGTRLPTFNSWAVIPGTTDRVVDIERAGGRLFFSGELGDTSDGARIAMVATTIVGNRQDVIPGAARGLAIGADRAYLAGFVPDGPVLTAIGDGIGTAPAYRVTNTGPTGTGASAGCPRGDTGFQPGSFTLIVTGDRCTVQYVNRGDPWPDARCRPVVAYHAGEPVATRPGLYSDGQVLVNVPAVGGTTVLEWQCFPLQGGAAEARYEFKGDIELIDPSGTVVDARSGSPVAAATVRLETAPARGARFGRPGLTAITPQVNPQVTGDTGAFGWDVAPGLWRLRIDAFGYGPLTSAVFAIPPEVTGLRMALRPDPAEQRLLLDLAAGRAGAVRLGAPPVRAAGLRVRARGGRVARIVIASGRYRTAEGIRIGSTEAALLNAFLGDVRRLRSALRGRVHRYPVGRGVVEVRGGRVTRIVLGR